MLNFTFLGINGSLQDIDSGNTSLLISGTKGSAAVDLSCAIAAITDADIDAVILTHEHIDHVYALPSLLHQLWLKGRARALDIYIPDGMEHLVNGLIDLFGIREKRAMFDIRLSTEHGFNAGTMRFTTFPTSHTSTSMGLVVEDGKDKLVYTCDTRPFKDTPPFMMDAQVLIHEASGLFKEEEMLLKKGHSSGADAGKLAREINAGKLYLCHLPRGDKAKAEILCEARTVFKETYIPHILKEESCS